MSSVVPRYRTRRYPTPVGFQSRGVVKYNGSRDSLLVSHGHPRSKSGGYATGGPFYQVSERLTYDDGYGLGDIWDFGSHYGPCVAIGINGFAAPNDLSQTPAVIPAFSDLESYLQTQYSARGFSRTRPGNPIASVGQFLVELGNDGFPLLPLGLSWKSLFKGNFKDIATRAKHRTREFLRLGDEYLNYKFGWAPFVSDLRKMYNLWHTIDKHLAKLVRENGKSLRRTATLVDQTTITPTYSESINRPGQYVDGFPSFVSCNTGSTVFQIVSESRLRVWYVGKYTYNVPDIGSSQWTRNAKLALFGALPTPELIWNVTPWSWLTDWFVNVGDVLSNFSDNAVGSPSSLSSSGYIMMNQKTTTKYEAYSEWSGVNVSGWLATRCLPGAHTFWTKQELEIKSRAAAGSQYQLAASMDAFNSDHWNILAALGLSKGHFHSR